MKFHKDPETESARIVGFEVKPFRLHHNSLLLVLTPWMRYLLWLLIFCYFDAISVKHEYEGVWTSDKPRLTTCDPHAKRTVTNSESPQEVEDKKEILFTYDVDFKVSSFISYS